MVSPRPVENSETFYGELFLPLPAHHTIAGRRILVVDDNAASRKALMLLLQSWQCRCDESADADAALEKLNAANAQKDPFSLAVIDMHMPGISGEELGKRIKQSPALRTTILVMMTTLGARGDAKRLEKIGFAAYLSKPIKQALLLDCLAALLNHQPFRLNNAPPTIVTRHSLADARRRSYRLLLADDNAINRKSSQGLLERIGFSVDAVENGEQVLQALKELPYNLILMDCQMPVLDGFEAARRIRTFSSIPIIALTAHASVDVKQRCIESGMNEYLTKPFNLATLKDTILKYLEKDPLKETQEKAETGSPPQPPADSPTASNAEISDDIKKGDSIDASGDPLFDKEALRERYMGDEEFTREIIDVFLEEAPVLLQALKSAVDEGDVKEVRNRAHAIKGTSGDICAITMVKISTAMEQAAKQKEFQKAASMLPQLEDQLQKLQALLSRK